MKKRLPTNDEKGPLVGTDSTAPSFSAWAVVEIFGHQKYAGKLSEFAIGGCNFVRVDVPEVSGKHPQPAFSKLFGQGAIYSITLVSEAIARSVVESIRPKPLNVYIPIVPERQITSRDDGQDDLYA